MNGPLRSGKPVGRTAPAPTGRMASDPAGLLLPSAVDFPMAGEQPARSLEPTFSPHIQELPHQILHRELKRPTSMRMTDDVMQDYIINASEMKVNE